MFLQLYYSQQEREPDHKQLLLFKKEIELLHEYFNWILIKLQFTGLLIVRNANKLKHCLPKRFIFHYKEAKLNWHMTKIIKKRFVENII